VCSTQTEIEILATLVGTSGGLLLPGVFYWMGTDLVVINVSVDLGDQDLTNISIES
jgi:hypothetical protein